MKPGGASLSLYHVEQRARGEVSDWHRDDHRPEVLGTVPGVYLAQRWEAPEDWVERRATTPLAHRGGEYAHLYWTTGSAAELDVDFRSLRPDLVISAAAVPAMSRNRGLMIVIGGRGPGIRESDFVSWQEHEWLPRLLSDQRLTGVARLVRPPETAVLLCYVDADPLAAFADLERALQVVDPAIWTTVFAGVYRKPG